MPGVALLPVQQAGVAHPARMVAKVEYYRAGAEMIFEGARGPSGSVRELFGAGRSGVHD